MTSLRGDVDGLKDDVTGLKIDVAVLKQLHQPEGIPDILLEIDDPEILAQAVQAATLDPTVANGNTDQLRTTLRNATSNDGEAASRALLAAVRDPETAHRILSIPN